MATPPGSGKPATLVVLRPGDNPLTRIPNRRRTHVKLDAPVGKGSPKRFQLTLRKGLTILMSRRMEHVYPRAIRLAEQRHVDLAGLVTHRFPLAQAAEAFRLNSRYEQEVLKLMVVSRA